jgi:hypothetical protein
MLQLKKSWVKGNSFIINEKDAYQSWSQLKAMININFLFQVLVFMGYVAFFDDTDNKMWYIIDGAVFVLLFIVTKIGHVAVRRRAKVQNLKCYEFILVLIIPFEIYKVFDLYDAVNTERLIAFKYSILISQNIISNLCWSLLIFLDGIGILIQIYTICLSWKFRQKGTELLDRVNRMRLDRASSSIEVPNRSKSEFTLEASLTS